MAKVENVVVTCDRCHKLFELKNARLSLHKIEGNTMTRVDLCPDCEAEVMKFIKLSRVQKGGV